jgi:hypothetical protein
MLCFQMFSSEQLYIAVHIRKTQGMKINLSCTKSYFTLSDGSRCCYRQMLKIAVCCKVISCCAVLKFLQNIGTLSNKQHHITHAVGWLPNYTNTIIYNTGSNEHT